MPTQDRFNNPIVSITTWYRQVLNQLTPDQSNLAPIPYRPISMLSERPLSPHYTLCQPFLLFHHCPVRLKPIAGLERHPPSMSLLVEIWNSFRGVVSGHMLWPSTKRLHTRLCHLSIPSQQELCGDANSG